MEEEGAPQTQSSITILFSGLVPSLLLSLVAMVTGRPTPQQRRLGLQNRLVAMEMRKGGGAPPFNSGAPL